MVNKNMKRVFVFAITLLFIAPFANAFGVSSPYWDEKPLVMYPGQSNDLQLQLQNMVGDENMKLTASVVEGGDIARLTDEDIVYDVPLGRKDVKVGVRVDIPGNAQLYGNYKIKVQFKQVAKESSGTVGLSGSVVQTIPVFIKSKEELGPQSAIAPQEEKPRPLFPIFALTLIVIALIALLSIPLLRKKK
ncbi:hypothetical protein HY500_01935 [Candidatus Woesearchaeota archaeon]|nr:hypothetical protein [Candidatus Woesearchaeota archaeon]